MNRLEDVIDMKKLKALLGKEEEKKVSPCVWIAVIVVVVAAVTAIGYALYRYFTPDYLENFEDDFDDEFDDSFFEDEDEMEEVYEVEE